MALNLSLGDDSSSQKRLKKVKRETKNGIIRQYARLKFARRSKYRAKLRRDQEEFEKVLKDEESRIKRIRMRFEKSEHNMQLLNNVMQSRNDLKLFSKRKIDGGPIYIEEDEEEEEDEEGKNEQEEEVEEEEEVGEVEEAEEETEDKLSDFKVAAMRFLKKKGKWQGVKFRESGFSGDFPHQKMDREVLLNRRNDNPLKRMEKDTETIRYFHFPANHMEWIEKAIKVYYDEDGKDTETQNCTTQLLSREHWKGQLHGSGVGKSLIHMRHMRSRCAQILLENHHPEDTENENDADSHDDAENHDDAKPSSNIVLFLPYLHWETNRRRTKMAQIVQSLTNSNKLSLERVVHKVKSCTPPKFGRESITNPVGRYLYDVAQLWDAMDYEADERLLRHCFSTSCEKNQREQNSAQDPPLHIRRTLDQSYLSTVVNTTERDTDQVVYRQTMMAKMRAEMESRGKNSETCLVSQNATSTTDASTSTKVNSTVNQLSSRKESQKNRDGTGQTKAKSKNITKLVGVTRVVMVDQLWMWILDENTIITSFPRRWGRNKPDSSGIHKSLREILVKKKIRSIYDLAFLIIDQCSKVFFDRTQPLDDRPEVMDLFAQAIGTAADNTTSAFNFFWDNVKFQSINTGVTNNEAAWNYLNINPEGVLLREAQDITEELNIIERIYKQQLTVVTELKKLVKNRYEQFNAIKKKSRKGNSSSLKEMPNITKEDITDAADLIGKLRSRIAEIVDLKTAATHITNELHELLGLKQQQASILEAYESVQQGRAIMVFTVATIFFLPLGFFTGFFGMNNATSTGNSWMTLGQQIMYMLVISAVLIVSVLYIATTSIFSTLFTRLLSRKSILSQLRKRWKQRGKTKPSDGDNYKQVAISRLLRRSVIWMRNQVGLESEVDTPEDFSA